MLLPLILSGILAVTVSCKKNYASESATELLTQKIWTLVSYGYDYNANWVIDASEESIRDCEKDNRYSFTIDGNGLYEDNSLSCGNGISELPFTWKLINGDTTLDFIFGLVKMSRLDDEQLIIYHETMDANGRQSGIYRFSDIDINLNLIA
jgi:hypothetical protein